MADGQVVFTTELDSSQVKEQLESLQSKIVKWCQSATKSMTITPKMDTSGVKQLATASQNVKRATESAKKGTENLGEAAKGTGEKASSAGKDVKELGEAAKETGKKASSAGKDVKELGEAAKETGKKASSAGKDVKELGEAAKETGKKAKENSNYLSNFAGGLKNGFSDLSGQVAGGVLGATLVTKAAGAIGNALIDVTKAGIEYNAQMEAYQTNFGVLLGDQAKALQHVAELREMAAKTPFGMEDLASASQTLLSFDVGVDDTMKSLQMLGDISLGNQEKFSSLSLAFAQVSAAGKLTGQDLLQISDCLDA